ncbi:multi-sensor signal transduction histidine kinase [Methylocella silvestris BL2]|uniref:histidine kinase n=1 Tax=Methylocella silvestris (strain DSM 15510 / CIP 108128 / LMG 27833 / NCIMB 13906 / BL2) TaxID=395965 RepID=B8ENP4_METSB|nr:multi-sensor signal transduction histidine kinase [Methylocella silvestris BL2]
MKTALAESPRDLLQTLFRQKSLFGKYIAYFVGLVAFVLTISSAVDVWITYRDTKNILLHAQGEKADAAARRVEQFMAELERQISWATRASVASPEQRMDDYRRILANTPAIAEIAQIDGSGKEIATLSRDGGAIHTGDDWTLTAAAREARQDGAWFGPVVFASTGPRMQIVMAHSGHAAGFTVAEIELKYLSDILNGIQAGPGISAYLTTNDGRLIAHTDTSLVGKNLDMSKLPQVHALNQTGAPLDIGSDLDGQSVLSAAATVPHMKWLLFVEQPVTQAFGPVVSLLIRLAWLFGLGLILCVCAGVLLARRMTVPIRAVQEGASRLASGDFDHPIEVHTGDEVEVLADEFNRMAAQLREFYARLEQKVDDRTRDLAQSVQELKALEEIGRALAASLDLSLVLQTALTRAVELAEADGGAIYTFDRERGAFHLAEAHGLDPSFVAALREVKLTRLDGLLGEVAEHGRTVQVPEIADCAGFPLRAATIAAGFRSALVVPLIAPDGVLGALVVESGKHGPFAANKVSLMQAFAHQSVLAMRNARLFRKAEENGRQLAVASEHKSRFFANMSHELRTPLNAILGYAELLRDGLYGELPDRAKSVLERVESNGAHLLGLINDVLDLSKLEAGELSLVLDEYSMRNIVEQAIGATYSLAQAKGLRIDQTIEEPMPLGRGDERRLTQVLINILSNAIKFTDEGYVAIKAQTLADMFEIVVTDTGPGIPPEDQARIFEAFQQGDNTSTRLKGGTGLGLSISRRFVEMHGGAISVASKLGEGSSFTILVPIRVERQKAAA